MATRKRFTKALFLRLCAVGLFICLGTFAVMHSIQNQKKQQLADAETSESEDDEGQKDRVPVTDENKGAVKQINAIEELNSQVGSTTKKTIKGANSTLPNFRSNSTPNNSTSRFPGSSTSSSLPLQTAGSNRPDDGNTKGLPKKSLVPPLGSRPGGMPSMQASSTIKPPGSGLPTRPNNEIPKFRSGYSNTGAPKNESDAEFAQRSSRAVVPGAVNPNRFGSANRSTTPPPGNPDSSLAQLSSSAAGLLDKQPPSATSNLMPQPRSYPTLPAAKPSNNSAGLLADRTRTAPPANPPGARSGIPPLLSDSSDNPTIASQASSRLPNLRPGAESPSTINPNLNRTPIVPTNPSQSLVPENSLPGRRVADTDSPSRSIEGIATRSPSSRPDMSSGTLRSTSSNVGSPSSIRNVSASLQQDFRGSGGQQPRSTLASAPINSSSSSAVAQPTPGASEFQGVQLPALAVQKLMPREIQVNREATFELIVKNTGKATANGVQVHDFVPEGTRFVQATPPASPTADGRIRWDIGSMQPGQQTSIKMKVLPLRPGNVGSVAHVTFGAQATAQTICTKPELSITAKAPETILIGQTLIMDITVENKGNGAAENVVIQEDVPDGLIFNGGQRELEYEVGTLRPGEARNIKLQLKAAKVGQVRNILAAHGAGDLMANESVDVRIVSPKLTVESSGPSRKFLNRDATHTFSVANRGSAPATNIQMVAQLPRGLRFVSAQNGQYDARNHAVVWRMARLDQQKSQDLEVTTTPVAVGQHQINFTVAADLNLREQTQQSLAVEQLSELFFDIDDTADAIEVGSGTTFRVKVVNQGQIPATNVRIKVEFPPALQPRSVQGVSGNPIQGQIVVLDTIPSLQPNQEVSFVISAAALQAGEHRTVVSVQSDDREIAVSKEESTHVYSDR